MEQAPHVGGLGLLFTLPAEARNISDRPHGEVKWRDPGWMVKWWLVNCILVGIKL
jgi:hypothetical protein